MYATHDDLISRFGALAIAELESMHNDGLLAVTNALSDASEKMNSYLSIRYQTPLNKTEHLKLVCADIARYLLYMNEPTDEVESRYKEALKWLQDVGAGKANVTFAEPLTADEQQKTYVKPAVPIGSSYPGQIFGDDVFAKMPSIK
ncbi:gp436 family protein [Psychrobacter namhaensis]|uniref:gp436 family protein n=1 Tax=Psychrobacter namhaensis TaxID=292734 RepID=UPI003D00CDA0